MRVKIPFNVRVRGEEDAVVLNGAWNTVKNVCAVLFAVLFLIGLPMLGARVGGTMAVVWLVSTAIAIAIIMFGAKAVAEQPSAMGRFGAVMMILLIVTALVVGVIIFQKMMATEETPISAVSTPVLVIPVSPAEKPTAAVASEPQPQISVPMPTIIPAMPLIPTQIEVEHSVHGSVSSVQVREMPPPEQLQQKDPLTEDPCDPGGEKASAWGRRE